MKITVVLHNIRSTYNVGAILRTAEGLGVERVVYSGYTPRFNDAELLPHLRDKLDRQIAKAALGAEKLVPQVYLDKNEFSVLTKWIECATTEGYTIVGLENNLAPSEMSKQLILGQRTVSDEQKATLNDKIVLILGEEVSGIPTEIRSLLDYFLEIPMHGQKESFNVSVATGIALWGLQNCYY